MLSIAELTGKAATHVVNDPITRATVKLQPEVFAAYRAMHAAATEAGLALDIASGFRDFERQRSIWNRKFNGAAPLYSISGEALDATSLSIGERIEAMMTWSAVPGTSRHHWGTDLDVFDPRPFADGKRQLELVPAEYERGGPCHELALWLYHHAEDFGFFFPYRQYRGGVAAEPWHLSYRTSAEQAHQQLSEEVLRQVLSDDSIAGHDYLLARVGELKERFIDTLCAPLYGDDSDGGSNPWLFG